MATPHGWSNWQFGKGLERVRPAAPDPARVLIDPEEDILETTREYTFPKIRGKPFVPFVANDDGKKPELGPAIIVSSQATAMLLSSVTVPGGQIEGQSQRAGGAEPPAQADPAAQELPKGVVEPSAHAAPGAAAQGPLQDESVSPKEAP